MGRQFELGKPVHKGRLRNRMLIAEPLLILQVGRDTMFNVLTDKLEVGNPSLW